MALSEEQIITRVRSIIRAHDSRELGQSHITDDAGNSIEARFIPNVVYRLIKKLKMFRGAK